MKHPTRSYLKEIPGQQIPKHDIAGFLDGKYDLKKNYVYDLRLKIGTEIKTPLSGKIIVKDTVFEG